MIRDRINERLPSSVKVGYITLRVRFSPSFTRTRRFVNSHADVFHRLFTAGTGVLFALMVLMALSLATTVGWLPQTGLTTLAANLWSVAPIQFTPVGILTILGAVMVIIIPHEFGHVVASFVYGARVEQVGIILLFGFLPVMAYVRNSQDNARSRPHAQLRIAAGGITMQTLLGLPLVPAMFALFGGIPTPATVAGSTYTTATLFITVLFYLNIELMMLNAIPIEILDGGSAYRSLAMIVDEYVTGTLEETGVLRTLMLVKNAALFFGFFVVFF